VRVRLRFFLADLPGPSGLQEIEVREGATVGEALSAYLQDNPIEDPYHKLPESMFLIGKQSAQLGSVLRDMDELTVMRILSGG